MEDGNQSTSRDMPMKEMGETESLLEPSTTVPTSMKEMGETESLVEPSTTVPISTVPLASVPTIVDDDDDMDAPLAIAGHASSGDWDMVTTARPNSDDEGGPATAGLQERAPRTAGSAPSSFPGGCDTHNDGMRWVFSSMNIGCSSRGNNGRRPSERSYDTVLDVINEALAVLDSDMADLTMDHDYHYHLHHPARSPHDRRRVHILVSDDENTSDEEEEE